MYCVFIFSPWILWIFLPFYHTSYLSSYKVLKIWKYWGKLEKSWDWFVLCVSYVFSNWFDILQVWRLFSTLWNKWVVTKLRRISNIAKWTWDDIFVPLLENVTSLQKALALKIVFCILCHPFRCLKISLPDVDIALGENYWIDS